MVRSKLWACTCIKVTIMTINLHGVVYMYCEACSQILCQLSCAPAIINNFVRDTHMSDH